MRLLNAQLTLASRFSQYDGFPVSMRPFPSVLVGRPNPNRAFHRLPVGNRFAERLTQLEVCPNDGSTSLGLCSGCHTMITEASVTKVEKAVGHIKVTASKADHPKIKKIEPITRGSVIMTKEKGTVMVVEERADGRNDKIGLILYVEGDAEIEIPTELPDVRPFHEIVGQRWSLDGKTKLGVERLLILRRNDKIVISRPSGDLVEVVQIVVLPDLSLSVVSGEKISKEEFAKRRAQKPEVAPEVIERALSEGWTKNGRIAPVIPGKLSAPKA